LKIGRLSEFAVIFLVICCCGLGVSSCAEKTIQVGYAGPLTGGYSDLGVQGRNGAMLAVEEINNSGGVAGKTLALIARNDKNSSVTAKKVDRDLIEKEVVAIIGHMTSNQSIAALPVVEKAEIVMLSPTTSTPKLSNKKDMFFRVQGATDFPALALGRFAFEELGIKTANLLCDTANMAYAEPFKENFIHAFQNSGGTVNGECTFFSEQRKDWDTIMSCLNSGNPDGILTITSARDTAELLQVIDTRSINVEIVSSGWAATGSLLSYGGNAVNGLIIARTEFANHGSDRYNAFTKKYQKRFGRTPSFAAVQAYDAVKVLAKALEKTGGKKKGLPQALVDIDNFPGLFRSININEYGDMMTSVFIMEVRNGTFHLIKKMEVEE